MIVNLHRLQEDHSRNIKDAIDLMTSSNKGAKKVDLSSYTSEVYYDNTEYVVAKGTNDEEYVEDINEE
jgi:hypothetical protein